MTFLRQLVTVCDNLFMNMQIGLIESKTDTCKGLWLLFIRIVQCMGVGERDLPTNLPKVDTIRLVGRWGP